MDLLRSTHCRYTQQIYRLISDLQFNKALILLSNQSLQTPKSRQALSLLAFCYFQLGDFIRASSIYNDLIQLVPDCDDYKFYYSLSLYKACFYEESLKSSYQTNNLEFNERVLHLKYSIYYSLDDYHSAQSLMNLSVIDDHVKYINLGCINLKEMQIDLALSNFNSVFQLVGFIPKLIYNIALCHYYLKQNSTSVKYINQILEKGIKDHPEFNIGIRNEGIDSKSVENSLVLHESALIEAFNLRAAIEYKLMNYQASIEALNDMPPRSEEELDPITLHNNALINMETSPKTGFEKLHFLLSQIPCPPETFSNLVLLYCKYKYYDLAADLLAENSNITYQKLSINIYDFLVATITSSTSAYEAFLKFDSLLNTLTDNLRKISNLVQEARQKNRDDVLKCKIDDYDELMELYLPVLMSQTKLHWDTENFIQVEKIFKKSVEFCHEHDVWKLNTAHVLFMQENRFQEAIGFYQQIVKKKFNNILNISAIVLANLCVSFIMTNQNEEAEELMRKIESEEEELCYHEPDRKIYHLCIVNLVIGTLYCSKGNYEFGISRVMKSLEPFNKKLGSDTWFYTKRCFCSLIENLAKHMIVLKDKLIQEIFIFCNCCELYGRDIPIFVDQTSNSGIIHNGKNTISYEARRLKYLLLGLL